MAQIQFSNTISHFENKNYFFKFHNCHDQTHPDNFTSSLLHFERYNSFLFFQHKSHQICKGNLGPTEPLRKSPSNNPPKSCHSKFSLSINSIDTCSAKNLWL
uniref:Putative ovule protein n=1 Tax=Solanum chacoense TaxID=4108 RepID=A0A0V0IIF4_SOLCH